MWVDGVVKTQTFGEIYKYHFFQIIMAFLEASLFWEEKAFTSKHLKVYQTLQIVVF